MREDFKSDGAVAGDPESPNNSLDSSFIQDGELVAHYFESGILSHAVSLLKSDGLKKMTFDCTLAHLGVYEGGEGGSEPYTYETMGGSCAEMLRDVWTDVEEGAAHACRAVVFDMVALSVSLGMGDGGAGVSISQSLLRHTPLLSHSFRTLTTEVVGLCSAISAAGGCSPALDDNLAAVASCCECLREVVSSSALRDDKGAIVGLSNLVPMVGAVPQALGVAMAFLTNMYSAGLDIRDGNLSAAVCSASRLGRLLFLVPEWGEGMLVETGRGPGLLNSLLDVQMSCVLRKSGAAKVALSERVVALDSRLSGDDMSDEHRGVR